ARRAAVVGIIHPLAVGDICLPLLAPELVLDDLGAVEPVLDMRAVDQDTSLVPFAGRPCDVLCGRAHNVVPGGRSDEAVLSIRVAGIVEDLVFRPGFPGSFILLGDVDTVNHPAVSALADPPFEGELEIIVTPARDTVAAFALSFGVEVNGAIIDHPFRRDAVAPKSAPIREALSIEQLLPLRFGIHVRRAAGLRRPVAAGD